MLVQILAQTTIEVTEDELKRLKSDGNRLGFQRLSDAVRFGAVPFKLSVQPQPKIASGTWDTESCGLPLSFPCPKTVNDFDRAAGYVGATQYCATQYIGLHDTLAEWQEKFAKRVAETFSIPRWVNEAATKKQKDLSVTGAVAPVYETVKKYIARVLALISPEQKKSLYSLAQTVANETPVDPSPTARRGAITVENYARAKSLLNAPPDIYEEKISKYSEYIGGFVLDRTPSNIPEEESLARLIQVYLKRRDDETREELANAD